MMWVMRTVFIAIASLFVAVANGWAEENLPEIVPVQEREWKAPISNVRAVLLASSKPLMTHFPDRELAQIRVRPKGGPIVLFKRGKNGEYDVRLNTGELFWSQYAYQFSHELCHILCNYREGKNPNGWFEESLCELASIYSLRRMAETWVTDAPYKNWRGYSKSLHQYAQNLMDKTRVPKDLGMWYRLNRELLKENATIREKNRVVSLAMLPIFEADPNIWGSIAYINDAEDRAGLDLPGYLQAWHRNAPERYRGGIAKIADLFGIRVRD